jgi:hypothetical protein
MAIKREKPGSEMWKNKLGRLPVSFSLSRITSASKHLAFTAPSANVVRSHQVVSSRLISHSQASHKLGSAHPVSRHQYPGHEIWTQGTHHQRSNRD